MSLDEAYATAIINEALDTDDEAENENAQPEPTKSADTIADEAVIAPEEPKKDVWNGITASTFSIQEAGMWPMSSFSICGCTL